MFFWFYLRWDGVGVLTYFVLSEAEVLAGALQEDLHGGQGPALSRAPQVDR